MRLRCGFASALLLWTAPVLAEESLVPVLVEADDDALRLDDELCYHRTCELRVTPGKHRLSREVSRGGTSETVAERVVDIEEPTVLRWKGPGILRSTATVTLVSGAAILVAGIVVPLVVCGRSGRYDQNGRYVDQNPCRDTSDGVKVAWIGGLGVGLTLAMLGAVGLVATEKPRLDARRWAVLPSVEPRRAGLDLVVRF